MKSTNRSAIVYVGRHEVMEILDAQKKIINAYSNNIITVLRTFLYYEMSFVVEIVAP